MRCRRRGGRSDRSRRRCFAKECGLSRVTRGKVPDVRAHQPPDRLPGPPGWGEVPPAWGVGRVARVTVRTHLTRKSFVRCRVRPRDRLRAAAGGAGAVHRLPDELGRAAFARAVLEGAGSGARAASARVRRPRGGPARARHHPAGHRRGRGRRPEHHGGHARRARGAWPGRAAPPPEGPAQARRLPHRAGRRPPARAGASARRSARRLFAALSADERKQLNALLRKIAGLDEGDEAAHQDRDRARGVARGGGPRARRAGRGAGAAARRRHLRPGPPDDPRAGPDPRRDRSRPRAGRGGGRRGRRGHGPPRG